MSSTLPSLYAPRPFPGLQSGPYMLPDQLMHTWPASMHIARWLLAAFLWLRSLPLTLQSVCTKFGEEISSCWNFYFSVLYEIRYKLLMELYRQMESELKRFCYIGFGCTYSILVQVLEFISLSLSLSLFQLFLTWMCSVICFPHSTETGTAERWVNGGRGEIRGCLCWCCCWKKCSSNDSLSDLCNVESHTSPQKNCYSKYIHSLKVLRYRAKRAREIKGNSKNNQQKQQPVLKCNVFCHSLTSWYCPHSCVYISRHPLQRIS